MSTLVGKVYKNGTRRRKIIDSSQCVIPGGFPVSPKVPKPRIVLVTTSLVRICVETRVHTCVGILFKGLQSTHSVPLVHVR